MKEKLGRNGPGPYRSGADRARSVQAGPAKARFSARREGQDRRARGMNSGNQALKRLRLC
ncbi:MAG: hypothetical protein ACR2OW_10000 [Methyloligellaceae bacterium]